MKSTRLARVAQTISGSGFPPSAQGLSTGDMPFVKVSDLARPENARAVIGAANWVTREAASRLGARTIPEGSTIFPKVGAALLGNARGQTAVPLVLDNNMMAVAPRTLHPRFLYWWLRTVDMRQLSDGGTLPFVSDTAVRDLQVPVTAPEEQRRVADFLDDRVTLIDQIIASRGRQIELVTEALRAESERAFSHMAIAEAPWLRLGATCRFFTDGDWIESPYIQDEGIRLIQTGNVGVGVYKEQGFRYISSGTFKTLKCTAVHQGDVLISRLASPVGRACLCPDLGGPAIASVDVTIARPQPWMDALFIVEFLSSPRHLSDTDELARGSTMQRVSRSQLSSIRVPRPDIGVQQRVGQQLADARRAASGRANQLRSGIGLLEEYKKSLIAAAVNGELDVTTAESGISGTRGA